MRAVNVLEAKTNLSRLLASLEAGNEEEILIARHGRPIARLTAVSRGRVGDRIGVAKGKFTVPDDIDAVNSEVLSLFSQDDHASAP